MSDTKPTAAPLVSEVLDRAERMSAGRWRISDADLDLLRDGCAALEVAKLAAESHAAALLVRLGAAVEERRRLRELIGQADEFLARHLALGRRTAIAEARAKIAQVLTPPVADAADGRINLTAEQRRGLTTNVDFLPPADVRAAADELESALHEWEQGERDLGFEITPRKRDYFRAGWRADQAARTTTLPAALKLATDALTEILACGVEFDDARVKYITIQVHRVTLDEVREALAAITALTGASEGAKP